MASSVDIQQLREVFDLCDELKVGYISVNKLRDIVRKHFGGSDEDICRLIECLDPNGGGVIDFPLFCEGVISTIGGAKDSKKQSPLLVVDGRSDSESPPPAIGHDTDSAIATGSDVSKESLQDKRDSGTGTDEEGVESYICQLSKPQENSPGSFRSGVNPRRRRGSRISNKTCSKRLSTSALASQLHRSGSRRNSESSDETPLDVPMSIEDDVLDLNHKVQELQQQVANLTDHQANTDQRYTRVKQENAALHNKIHSLEEQLKDLEVRSEDRLETERHKFKETMARCERESKLEVEQYATKLFSLQKEYMEVSEESMKLKGLVARLKQEKADIESQLNDLQGELMALKEEHQCLQEGARKEREQFQQERDTSNRLLEELTCQLERAQLDAGGRLRSPSLLELPAQYRELQQELHRFKDENKLLLELNEEANAQLLANSLQEGRTLLNQNPVISLADEFDTLTKDDMLQRWHKEKEVNAKLKEYIDGILLNIIEKNPDLLEKM